ncbi:LacI family DNA-binding transcriptional regulator [Paenibacillus sp. GYB003]|uniref:LacI family DNA-binding transcriptional regulator n=1 Tax=Paenibacillus sp. GYB003 TaxID=2994392 RepID=UPI002F9667F4
MKRKSPTIVDVAKYAGVSIGTVSNVLNRRRDVPLAEDTVLKVNEAIRELGYRRNAIAANLSRQRTYELGMLLPGYDEYFVKFAGEVEQIVLERGYHLSVFSAPEKPELGRRHLELLLQRRVDGLFCHGLAMPPDTARRIINEGTPIVLFNAWGWPDDIAAGRVNLDVVTACAEAVVHLFEQGCRTILYLGNGRAAATDEQRRIGFAEGMRRLAGEPVASALLDTGTPGWLNEIGRLAEADRPVGVLGFDDLTAFNLMSKLLERGYRIPEQVKIVGINNTYVSRMSYPGMTSIQNHYKMQAEAAVRMMLRSLGDADEDEAGQSGAESIAQSVSIPLTLIPRKSTER